MKLHLLLSVALAGAGLTACDNSSSTASDKAAPPPSKKPPAAKIQKSPNSPQTTQEDTAPIVVAGGITFPPAGRHRADVLVEARTKEANAIALRLQQVMAADPDWFVAYAKGHDDLAPGVKLPYHPKFGITEQEYDLYLKAIANSQLKKLSNAVVRFAESRGKLTLSIEGLALPTDTFTFSADGQTMQCSLGTSGAPTVVDQKNATSPAGVWKGNNWTVSKGDFELAIHNTEDAYTVDVAVGMDTKQRHLIYLRMSGRRNQVPMNISHILRWPQ